MANQNMSRIPSFLEALDIMRKVHETKNADYASSENPFSNFDVSEYGLRLFSNPRDGAFVWPIFTKLARLSTLLAKTDKPNHESIEDTFIDIGNYILLWRSDYLNRPKRGKPEWLDKPEEEVGINQVCAYCGIISKTPLAVMHGHPTGPKYFCNMVHGEQYRLLVNAEKRMKEMDQYVCQYCNARLPEKHDKYVVQTKTYGKQYFCSQEHAKKWYSLTGDPKELGELELAALNLKP